MNTSETIKAIATALSKFQGEVSTPKNNADNPYFSSKYAPLNEVIKSVKPVLAKNGLSITQNIYSSEQQVSIKTLLLHESGEWLESDCLVLPAEQKFKDGKKEITAQGAGSGITYGRRYQLSAILGISSEDDDDGNHASQGSDELSKSDKPEPPQNKSAGNAPVPSDLEKRATGIYYAMTGNKEGQRDWPIDEYKSWLKDFKESKKISTDYGKKWTLKDIEYLESQINELPF